MHIEQWTTDAAFNAVNPPDEKTLVDHDRRYVIFQACSYAKTLPGDGEAAELGVFRGGTAKLIGNTLRRPVHLFDTWEGLPQHCVLDRHHKGDFNDVDFEQVKHFLHEPIYAFYRGFFPDTAQSFKRPLAFVHLDGDLYHSTADGLRLFWPLLVPGGIIVLDDYGWDACPGVKQAVSEFCIQHGVAGLGLSNGQFLLWKAR